MTNIGRKNKKKQTKTEAVNAYLIKNSKGEGEEKKKRKKKWGGGHSHKQSKDWMEFYGYIK